MEAFQVYARIRPFNSREVQMCYGKKATQRVDPYTVSVGGSDVRQTLFQVDQVFGEEVTNEDIFAYGIQPLVDTFLGGINSTVLAYGITGAGKSHTMFGSQGQNWQAGLIELVLQYLCGAVSKMERARVCLSYMEIYNQQVLDLLKPKSYSLQIVDDPVLGVVVNDLQQMEIHSTKSAQTLIELGNTRRVVAETKANEFSSRSHAVVQIALERTVGDSVVIAKLSLVDLAGSERQSVYSQQRGLRNLEGSNINRSLLTLGNCITVLSEKKKGFVPYRDSKLTRLLKDSLGGNTKTVMIACISPSVLSYQQTLNTMKYACRARRIEKAVHQNVREPKTQQQLKKEVCRLKKLLQAKDEEKGNEITKEQMQEFIHRLVKNVQTLTLLRCAESSQLNSKMKEVELMEEQGRLIATMMMRCQSDQENSLIGANTDNNSGDKFDKQKLKKSMSVNELRKVRSVSHQPQMRYIPELNEQSESVEAHPSEGVKGGNFIRGNLQNVRLQCQREKKIIRELIDEYMECWQLENERQGVIQKARQLLSGERGNQFLGADDRRILQKIVNKERLEKLQVNHYNTQEVNIVECGLQMGGKQHRPEGRESNNRFLSSLQEVRKMMRRISSGITPVQEQEPFHQETINISNNGSKHLFCQQ